jgi:hypothetical protein
MAQQKVEMELIKQVLQLYNDGVAIREIERRTGVCRNSIKNTCGSLTLLQKVL